MEKHIIGIILMVSISTLIRTVDAQVCGNYGFFCTSCSTLQICQSNIPTGSVLTCPEGSYCDQTSTDVCGTTTCSNEPYPFYECTSEGRFAWVYNCSEYIWCLNVEGTLTPTINSCPASTVFNPNSATCVLATSYDCVDVTTTQSASETTTVTTEATTSTTEATFVCTPGRYAVTSDTTCQSYYYCYANDDGTFTLYEMVCPTTTVFNPTTAKCVLPSAYTCTN